MKATTSHRFAAVTAMMLGATLALAGCQQEGPAERAGKSIDETQEETGEYYERQQDQTPPFENPQD